MKQFITPIRSIEEIANEIFARHGGNIETIRECHGNNKAKAKLQEIVWLVSLISAKAHSEGWGYSAIGRYLHRNHDVVMHHCKRVKNA